MRRCLASVLVCLVCGCGRPAALRRRAEPAPPLTAMPAVGAGLCDFSAALFRQTFPACDGNALVAPFSVATALARVRLGAVGETAAELDRVLGRTLEPADWYHAVGDIERALGGIDKSRDEELATRLSWSSEFCIGPYVEVAPSYARAFKRAFGDRFVPLQSTGEAGLAVELSQHVAELTGGEITDFATEQKLLPVIEQPTLPQHDVGFVIVSLLDLTARWSNQFGEKDDLRAFHRLAGRPVTVPMMRATDLSGGGRSFRYLRAFASHVVELPYRDGELAMVLIVPDSGGLPAAEEALAGGGLRTVLTNLQPRHGNLTMPHWEQQLDLRLDKPLEAAGLHTLFLWRRAALPNILRRRHDPDQPTRVWLQSVLQRGRLKVDEHGTVARVVTAGYGVAAECAVSDPGEPFDLVVDRPFVYVVWHRPTGAVLLLGRVVDPSG